MKYVKKYQGGGGFNVFSPYIKSTPEAPPSNSSGTSTDNKFGSSLLDDKLYGELIKGGLINDVNNFVDQLLELENSMNMSNIFGGSSTTSGIRLIAKVNEVRRNKELYTNAANRASRNGALNEIAVGDYGEVYVRSGNSIKAVSADDYRKNASKLGQVLTVRNLLEEREKNPNLAWDTSIFTLAENSVGMGQVKTHIQNIVNSIVPEEYEQTSLMSKKQIESLTGVPTSQADVASLAKLKQLLDLGKDLYSITTKTSTERRYLDQAMNYIWRTLDVRAQNKLNALSKINGTDPQTLIGNALQFGTEYKESYKGEIGKDPESDGSGSKAGEKPLTQFQMFFNNSMKGVWTDFMRNDPKIGTLFRGSVGAKGPLVDKKDNPIGFSKLSDVLIGNQYGSMIDMSNIYFGNAKVTTPDLNNIIYNASEDSGIIFMPVNNDGSPDYESLQRFNEANQIFEANKSNWSAAQVKKHFANYQFNVDVITSKEGGVSVQTLAESSKVKPFLVMSAYTNDAVETLVDNNENWLTRLEDYELEQMEPYFESIWTVGSGKSAKNLTPRNPFWKFGTPYYKGVVVAPVKLEASVIANALSGQGPLQGISSMDNVKINIKNSNQAITGGLNPLTSSTILTNN